MALTGQRALVSRLAVSPEIHRLPNNPFNLQTGDVFGPGESRYRDSKQTPSQRNKMVQPATRELLESGNERRRSDAAVSATGYQRFARTHVVGGPRLGMRCAQHT